MTIDWDAENERIERPHRAALEAAREARRQRRAAYLADTERIARERPEAIEIALRLLKRRPDGEAKIKAAAEVADLEQLREWERTAHFAVQRFE